MLNKYEFEYTLCKLYQNDLLNATLDSDRCDAIIGSIENSAIRKYEELLGMIVLFILSVGACIALVDSLKLLYHKVKSAVTTPPKEGPLTEKLML
jgi:hypothetical protein